MIRSVPLPTLHFGAIIAVLGFISVEILRYMSIPAPFWVYHYINDFLCIPIVSVLSLYGVWWIKRDKSIRIRARYVVGLVAFFSVYFEIYLPRVTDRYTGDVWDAVCYALGGLVFYSLQKIE